MPHPRRRSTRPRPRWRRRKDARPEEILQAALDVFATRGYAATRLDEVGRRAGVTKGTIYLYFPGKAALFKAVVRTSIVPLLERAEAAAAGHVGSSADALRGLLRGLWDVVGESKLSGLPKLIMAEAANFPDLARFYHDEVASRALGLIAGLIRRGTAGGEFRPVDPRAAAMAGLGSVLFAVIWKHSLHPYAGEAFDFRRYIDLHAETFLRGLASSRDQDASHA
jgi:AcrR family transcriptional regulator